jgi:5-hydroxyisourate hydrolase-like protein (transthyretin family)
VSNVTKSLALVLSLFLGSQAAPQTPQPPYGGTGKISGQVVALDSGRPIANAQLRLIRWEGGRGSQTSVRSDAQGHFEFAKLMAGQYQVNVTAERYLSLEFGQRGPLDTGRRIDLADGQVFDKADFTLPRTSAIDGQVFDEFGDPVPGITIQVARVEFAVGARRLMPVGSASGNRPTDDLGRFRIFNLPPGDYYLLALSGAFVMDPTQSADSAGFAPTYFPGTTLPTDAQPVHLGVGQDVAGVTFALHPAPMATIAGRVVNETGKPIPGATVMLAQLHNNDVLTQILARAGTSADGGFEYRNVAPGSYVLQAFGPPVGGGNLGRSEFGYLTTIVNGRDLRDLQVIVPPGRNLRGRFVFDGDASGIKPEQVSVFPRPVEFVSGPLGGGPPASVTRDDWTFEVSNMSGRRLVAANVGAQGWIVKRVMLNDKDITDEPVDFSAGDVDGVEIFVTNKISTVTGTVTDTGKPVSDYVVVVFSENTAKWTFPTRSLGLARPTQQGSFRIQGLPADRYLAVALTSVQGSEWQSPEFLTKMRAVATPFTLADAESVTLVLKLVK